MERMPEAAQVQRQRFGGRLRVLLVVENAQLLLHLSEAVRSTDGLQLVGAFTTALDVVDWTLWDRGGWHIAFVDLALRDDGGRAVIKRLLEEPRPGSIVALGNHLWREIREECAGMGVHHLLEKGDLIAFRGFLEGQVR